VRILLSHAGGFVPYASYRLAVSQTMESKRPLPEILEDFRSFYFDTAISGTPAALPSLLAFAKPGHVLFGSDWPFLPAPAIAGFTAMLDAYAGLDANGHAAIDRDNAAHLFEENR
jgi:predicted TIM-barrel fold metal-dependent hydrolase